jgi:hypothetical protein
MLPVERMPQRRVKGVERVMVGERGELGSETAW